MNSFLFILITLNSVYPNFFIIYILSLLSLVVTVVWLNSINVNQNSTSTEITTPTPQQVKKSPITKKNNTLPKPTIPFTIPKQTEKFTPKEIIVAIELQPKAYLLH